MKFIFKTFITLVFISIIPVNSTHAQSEDELNLKLSRDFGYSSGTGRIQGTFSMHVTGPDNLTKVEFLMDDIVIGEVKDPPFRFQFNTDSYSEGVHTMIARGYTLDGKVLSSNERRAEFVSSQEVPQQVLKIILPIFALIFVISIISILIPALSGKRKRSTVPLGSSRSYGMSGGAICPKCKRPFGINVLAINLLIGKLDRCPHCGRWTIVQRASVQELRMAEAAELEQTPKSNGELQLSEEGKLKKEIDESKYQDI